MSANERMLAINDVELCVQTFGDRHDPAILLIAGAAASMDWWEDPFCQRLADGRRFVIRYDNRDTGQSTHYPAGSPGYSQLDLAADALGILDAFDLRRAHVVGISMGGGIAQRLAVQHPERIASLTLMSTSPGGPGGPLNPDLPPMADRLLKLFAEPPSSQPDWLDRSAAIAAFLDGERTFSGSIPVDADRISHLAGRAFDRTHDMAASQTNHWILEGGESIRDQLGGITARTLVLHGTEDPLFPYGHAQALAAEIPGAVLIPLDGMGHQQPPPQVWDMVIPAILQHTETEA